jgi:hypothetical protein
LQLRYSHPRRTHARRSCEPAFVHRKNRFFADKRSHSNVRAGGVSPRGAHSAREFDTPKFTALPLQTRFANPRRAHARRSCEPAFVHRKNRFFADRRSHCTKSGGRKPPVGCIRYANSKRGNPARLPLQTWFPTSGGLTPVAERTRPQLQLRYSHPRRVDARRSCDSAVIGRRTTCCQPDDRTIRR